MKTPFEEWLELQPWPASKKAKNLLAYLQQSTRPDDPKNWEAVFTTMVKTGENYSYTMDQIKEIRKGARMYKDSNRPRLIANPAVSMCGQILQLNQALIRSFAKHLKSFCVGRKP